MPRPRSSRPPLRWVAADVGGAAPATRPVTFAIGSEPAGANVFDETGKPLGVTPLLIERPASDGEVSFVVRRRGFRDGKLMLRADRDGQANVSLEVLPRKVPRQAQDRPLASLGEEALGDGRECCRGYASASAR
jgi:hypothetical protein